MPVTVTEVSASSGNRSSRTTAPAPPATSPPALVTDVPAGQYAVTDLTSDAFVALVAVTRTTSLTAAAGDAASTVAARAATAPRAIARRGLRRSVGRVLRCTVASGRGRGKG